MVGSNARCQFDFFDGRKPLRAWVSGLARAAGSWETDKMRTITGEWNTAVNGSSATNYAVHYSASSPHTGAATFTSVSGTKTMHADSDGSYSNAGFQALDTSLLGLNFSGTETAGKNVASPMIIYLGRAA